MDPEQIPIRDLHLPAEIGWWPLAPGWWVLLALVMAGLLWLAYRGFVRWRANRARRVALRQLRAIAAEYAAERDAVATSRQLSELLRRALLAYAPRSIIAGLTGERWLEFLDAGLETPVFVSGPGRDLESLPYRRPATATREVDIDALIGAVRTRLSTPLPEGAF